MSKGWGTLCRNGVNKEARRKAGHLRIGLSPPKKDADPDIPILKQAKAEYAKLQ